MRRQLPWVLSGHHELDHCLEDPPPPHQSAGGKRKLASEKFCPASPPAAVAGTLNGTDPDAGLVCSLPSAPRMALADWLLAGAARGGAARCRSPSGLSGLPPLPSPALSGLGAHLVLEVPVRPGHRSPLPSPAPAPRQVSRAFWSPMTSRGEEASAARATPQGGGWAESGGSGRQRRSKPNFGGKAISLAWARPGAQGPATHRLPVAAEVSQPVYTPSRPGGRTFPTPRHNPTGPAGGPLFVAVDGAP